MLVVMSVMLAVWFVGLDEHDTPRSRPFGPSGPALAGRTFSWWVDGMGGWFCQNSISLVVVVIMRSVRCVRVRSISVGQIIS
jgi:hypothetical protein